MDNNNNVKLVRLKENNELIDAIKGVATSALLSAAALFFSELSKGIISVSEKNS